MSNTRVILMDPDEPGIQEEVKISISEAMSACIRYLNDKKYQASIDMYTNEKVIGSWDYWNEGDIT